MDGQLIKERISVMEFDLFKYIKEHRPHLISNNGDCVIWNGTMQNNYPRICVKKSFYWPRSEMYIKHKGAIKRGCDVISLTCGNPRCLNPEHMVLATKAAPFLKLESISNHLQIKAKGILAYLFLHKHDLIKRDGHCHIWIKNITKGSPHIWINNKRLSLRQEIYKENHGEFDKTKYVIRTNCGENGCLNPLHLELVPRVKGLTDYYVSNKHYSLTHVLKRTLCNPSRKLDFNQVVDIRNSSESISSLANKYNVHKKRIWDVKNYKTFKIIPSAFGLLKVG